MKAAIGLKPVFLPDRGSVPISTGELDVRSECRQGSKPPDQEGRKLPANYCAGAVQQRELVFNCALALRDADAISRLLFSAIENAL